MPDPDSSSDTQGHAAGKFILHIDCEDLLKVIRDSTNGSGHSSTGNGNASPPEIFGPKGPEEVAREFALVSVLGVPIIHTIKLKMFHTCGQIQLTEDNVCVEALYAIGDWFVEQYALQGKTASCEKSRGGYAVGDLTEPDAIVTVLVD